MGGRYGNRTAVIRAAIVMASAAGLLEAYPEYDQHVGYLDVIRLTRQVSGDVRDVEALVRRVVFNVVAHNRDDHARNVAYLWTPSAGWRLTPAFDLTHSMGPRPAYVASGPGGHYLDVAGKGKDITRQDLVGLSTAAGLKPAVIGEMVDAALAAIDAWPALSAANGIDHEVADQVASRLPALTAWRGCSTGLQPAQCVNKWSPQRPLCSRVRVR